MERLEILLQRPGYRSTLDGVEIEDSIRRNGNTTRQIDLAINLLFSGFTVVVRDHSYDGEHVESNRALLGLILQRLEKEHGLRKNNLEVDIRNFTVKLLGRT